MLFEAEHETALAIAHSLSLPAIEDQFKETIGPKRVDTWTYTNKNSIMYIPDGVELTKAEQLEQVNKRQGIDYGNTRFNANPFNEQQSKETINELAKSQVYISFDYFFKEFFFKEFRDYFEVNSI